MANVRIGYGAGLWLEDDLGAMVEVAEVISIGLPNPQQNDVLATHFKSPGRQNEYVSGLIDNGEVQFGVNYIAGSPSDLLINEALTGGEPRDVVVAVPAGASMQYFEFSAIVKGYEKEIPIDDRQTATITMRVNGEVTQSSTNPIT